MTERLRPDGLREAIDTARVVTDNRTDFEVYMDVARKLVRAKLEPHLSELAVSDERKKQIVELESFSRAQPAHLRNASVAEPIGLISMLDEIGVLQTSEDPDASPSIRP